MIQDAINVLRNIESNTTTNLSVVNNNDKYTTENGCSIKITSINKEILGAVAAKIRAYKKPEPFKGKGIKYENEFIFRKEGKKK